MFSVHQPRFCWQTRCLRREEQAWDVVDTTFHLARARRRRRKTTKRKRRRRGTKKTRKAKQGRKTGERFATVAARLAPNSGVQRRARPEAWRSRVRAYVRAGARACERVGERSAPSAYHRAHGKAGTREKAVARGEAGFARVDGVPPKIGYSSRLLAGLFVRERIRGRAIARARNSIVVPGAQRRIADR